MGAIILIFAFLGLLALAAFVIKAVLLVPVMGFFAFKEAYTKLKADKKLLFAILFAFLPVFISALLLAIRLTF